MADLIQLDIFSGEWFDWKRKILINGEKKGYYKKFDCYFNAIKRNKNENHCCFNVREWVIIFNIYFINE